ncbi:hypothetical protein [Paraburkholderia sp. GAS32]|uniref:hypothetical protein n=1 Tax=Paraburkholderia sp. GAS32 TaxID=3035129 RepID=UPI003D1ACBE5
MEKFFLVVMILSLSMLVASFIQYRSMPKTIFGKLWCIVVATTVMLCVVGLVLARHAKVQEHQPGPRERPLAAATRVGEMLDAVTGYGKM